MSVKGRRKTKSPRIWAFLKLSDHFTEEELEFLKRKPTAEMKESLFRSTPHHRNTLS